MLDQILPGSVWPAQHVDHVICEVIGPLTFIRTIARNTKIDFLAPYLPVLCVPKSFSIFLRILGKGVPCPGMTIIREVGEFSYFAGVHFREVEAVILVPATYPESGILDNL